MPKRPTMTVFEGRILNSLNNPKDSSWEPVVANDEYVEDGAPETVKADTYQACLNEAVNVLLQKGVR